MPTDKIVFHNKFHNGVSKFSDTSVGSQPLGYSPFIHHNKDNNGISGFPADTFLDPGIPPTPSIGAWTLHEAFFEKEILSGASKQVITTFAGGASILRAFSFADSGNKLFRLVYQAASTPYVELREYTLTIPYSISTAEQTSNTATFDTATQDFFFKDGGNLFVVESSNAIRQYTLTSYDLSTLSAPVTSYTLQGTNAHIWFKSDGTKLFSGATDANTLYEYDLSVAWQLSSIAYNSNNKTLYNPILDLYWSDDGVYCYVWHNPAKGASGDYPNAIQQYTAGVAWDVTSITSPSTTVTKEGATVINNTYHFVLSNSGNDIYYTKSLPYAPSLIQLIQQELGTTNDIESLQGEVTYKNILDLSSSFPTSSISAQFLDNTGTYYFFIEGGDIHAYILAEPFNVGTAGSEVASFSAPEGGISSFTFNVAGTILYYVFSTSVGTDRDEFHQYSLTAWDLTTATDTTNIYIGNFDGTSSFFLSDNGVYLYAQRFFSNAKLKRFTLSTPFDVSTMGSIIETPSTTPFSRGMSIDNTATSVIANVDGNFSGKMAKQFILNTPTDVTTLATENVAFPIEFLNDEPILQISQHGYIEPNGKFLYIPCGLADDATIYFHLIVQVALTSPCANCWSVANLAYNSLFADVSVNVTTPKGIDYNESGIDAYIVAGTGIFYHYTTLEKYQAKDLGFESSTDISVTDNNLLDVFIAPPYDYNTTSDVLKRYVFILGGQNNNIYQYLLWGGDFTISFALNSTFSVATQTTNPKAIAFSSDGLKLFVLDGNGTIYQYTNSESFANSFSYDTVSITIPDDNDCTGLRLSVDGFKFYVTGNQNKKIYEYTMPTRATLTGATKTGEFSVASQVEAVSGLFVKRKGDNFQVASSGVNSEIFQYDIT